MTLEALLALAGPGLAGLLAAWTLETLLVRPRPQWFWRRPLGALALQAGFWGLVYVGELLLWQRPWFALANMAALAAILGVVNHLKVRTLHEPFVVQDFEYFVDVFRHPRLYFPFFGWWRALALAAGFALAVVLAFLWEASAWGQWGAGPFLWVCLGVALASAALLALGHWAVPRVSFEPESDVQRLGLLASCWAYAVAERAGSLTADESASIDEAARRKEAAPMAEPRDAALSFKRWASAARALSEAASSSDEAPLPHLIAIQSESFFDVRRWLGGEGRAASTAVSTAVSPEVYAGFDAMAQQAWASGTLEVPAWGANTVRTEFAFLSGLSAAQLGVHQFNPYRVLARQNVPTMARALRRLGYYTVCLHPYPASFYQRERVYPQLGFDAFVDIAAFGKADYVGPYVGDVAVAREVMAMLTAVGTEGRQPGQPLFVFVITMENHGPLHLEQLAPGDEARLYTAPAPAGCRDLTLYLRHVANAGAMLKTLQTGLDALAAPCRLCFFGDHVPILGTAYKVLGEPDGRTDFLLWDNIAAGRAKAEDAGRAKAQERSSTTASPKTASHKNIKHAFTAAPMNLPLTLPLNLAAHELAEFWLRHGKS